MQAYDNIWKSVYSLLAEQYSQTILQLWFSNLELIALNDHCVVLLTNSDMIADIISRRFSSVVEKAFETTMGFEVQLVVLSNEHKDINREEIQQKCNQNIPIASFSIENNDNQQQVHRTESDDVTNTTAGNDTIHSTATQQVRIENPSDVFTQPNKTTTEPADTNSVSAQPTADQTNAAFLSQNQPIQQTQPFDSAASSFSTDRPTTSFPLSAREHTAGDSAISTNGFGESPKKAVLSSEIDWSKDESLSFVEREYTFENFIVGNSNKFAYSACLAVADYPATNYNPLFLYGPSGIGKTHLLYAIRNRVRERKPQMSIVYVKGEEFANQLINAMHEETTEEFRNKYRKADILLIDDIHFIAGKPSTQEEFFNTFNALFEEQKQLIFTSDRPPKDIKTLEDRLRTRFEWGLIADIQPPDYELRIAILKSKAKIIHIDLSMDILVFLGDKLKGNIRQIEGAIKRLRAYQDLTNEEITLENTKEILSDVMSGPLPENVKIEKILSAVTKKYGVSLEELKGKKRSREIALARHIAIYIVRQMTEKSYPEIGKIFNRDHTTVLSSIEVIDKRMKEDVMVESEVNDLMREIASIS